MIKMMTKIGLLVKKDSLMKIMKKKNIYFIKSMIKIIQIATILDILSKFMMIMETSQQ